MSHRNAFTVFCVTLLSSRDKNSTNPRRLHWKLHIVTAALQNYKFVENLWEIYVSLLAVYITLQQQGFMISVALSERYAYTCDSLATTILFASYWERQHNLATTQMSLPQRYGVFSVCMFTVDKNSLPLTWEF